ncbi:MAG: DUF5916 domain-containing protein [Candidatus Aminicenantales bacterium]
MKFNKWFLPLSLIPVIVFAVSLSASETVVASKASVAPVIDGLLDEAVWETALTFTDFKTYKPDYGKEPSQKTEAYFLFDAENLYIAFRCYDTDPGKIKANISKRDDMFADDYVGFCLDTFSDAQNAYLLMVNPLGIQGDGLMNSIGNMEPSMDFVWYSKGRIDDQGYSVECRIPLQSLRFSSKKTVIMGMAFVRQIVRASENSSCPAIYPDKGSLISQLQPVSITGLTYNRVVEILPALTHSDHSTIDDGRLRRDARQTDFSLTAKVGLTSDLTADAAYNPDFSQVESDAGQVDFNIRYSLYYPEKRPFFMEGIEYFQFAANPEDSPLRAVVYTRTIIDPVFGFKATGKLGPKSTIAAIYAHDNLPGDAVDRYPDFAIVRFRHSLKDDSYVGGFYTSRFQGNGFNQVAGTDGRFRLTGASVAEYHLLGSFTRNPGAESTVEGHALSLYYNYGTRSVYTEVGLQDISKFFQVDSGYVARTGISRFSPLFIYRFYPKSGFFQRIEPFYWGEHIYDKFYGTFETINVFVLRFWLPRNSMFRVDGLLGNEVYAGRKFNLNSFRSIFQTQLTKHLYLEGLFRRGGLIYYDPADPYQGYGNQAQVYAEYQPLEKLSLGLSYTYIDFNRKSDRQRVYDYGIIRSRNTFQVNKYLFLRAIFEYNTFYRRLATDGLISFTYIPGTVVHIGYGSAYEKLEWIGAEYIGSRRFLETQRGFFFKVSYLWRW